MEEQWLTIANYAEVNGISLQAVYKRMKNGSIPEDRIRYRKKSADTKREYAQIMLADIEDLKQ